MISTKSITLTGYAVQYVDLREPKPRQIQAEIFPIDEDFKKAAALLGLDLPDVIRQKYAARGFYCTAVERIPGKKIAAVNLRELWEQVQPEP